ncbi:MAG: hypothetical protein R2748_04295 [Bryobacterales bacterium]
MLFVVVTWLGFSFAVRERVIFPLRTLLQPARRLARRRLHLARARHRGRRHGRVMTEVNLMSAMLREQRLSALEASRLLRNVMEEIDVAVFTFDSQERLKLVNRAGSCSARRRSRLLDLTAEELGLGGFLQEGGPRAAELELPGGSGRYRVSRSSFRREGRPHRLLVLSDVTRELRAEELAAWQRLVRVLGHELNNSLAPVKSLAGSMRSLVDSKERPSDWQQDMAEGLSVIESRVDALSRFTASYTRLAKLPEPRYDRLKSRAVCVGSRSSKPAHGRRRTRARSSRRRRRGPDRASAHQSRTQRRGRLARDRRRGARRLARARREARDLGSGRRVGPLE